MKKVCVSLGERSYNILVGEGAIGNLPKIIRSMRFKGPIVVISDEVVFSKTIRVTAPVFRRLPNRLSRIIVPPTERSKSFHTFEGVIRQISKKTRTYRPLIIALGGGVVGDLAGFVAAAYRRGLPLIQLPTTLLAQVDSSIGGKVAIDLPHAKNLVGAFYQPRAVLADPVFLKSLSRRDIRNGLAEVIKYAIIKSKSLFNFLEKHRDDILALDKDAVERIVYECASIKARVVEKDEFDRKDIRIILNFGHTLGHAVEAASGYSNRYGHGESIALGMILASEIAVRLDMLKMDQLDRIKNLIGIYSLPVSIKDISIREIMGSYEYDKKFVSGVNRFVLPRRIGSVEVIEDIPYLLIKTVLKRYVE